MDTALRWWTPGKMWDIPQLSLGYESFGTQEIINGSFREGDRFWQIGSNWYIQNGRIYHTPGSTSHFTYPGTLINLKYYEARLNIQGTAGSVTIYLGGTSLGSVNYNRGDIFVRGNYQSQPYKLRIVPSSDFNGSISGISLTPYYDD